MLAVLLKYKLTSHWCLLLDVTEKNLFIIVNEDEVEESEWTYCVWSPSMLDGPFEGVWYDQTRELDFAPITPCIHEIV